MPHLKASRLSAATRGLAGVLATVLLVFAVLAAHGGLHQALHHSGKAVPNTCILCSLTHGHVDLAEPVLRVCTASPAPVGPAPLIEFAAPADFRYLFSPSRAPPAVLPLLSVVA